METSRPWADRDQRDPGSKTAHDLEWSELLEQVAAYCTGEAAKRRVRALLPARSFEEAVERAEALRAALELEAEAIRLPTVPLPDLEPLFERVLRGGSVSGAELQAVATMLGVAGALRDLAARERVRFPVLARHLDSQPELDLMRARLLEVLEPDGSLSDRASPELARARQRVEALREQVLGELRRLVVHYRDVLRPEEWTEREGRYVLLVRADAHYRVPGLVLGASASGATVYLEPEPVVSLGNQLVAARAEVRRQETSLLAELGRELRAQHGALLRAWEACLQADLLAACVAWAGQVRAQAVVPCAEPRLSLCAMRHPLLVGRVPEVIPNDLEVEPGRVLVISGPNGGGKTVALKCLGLAVWMVQAGLPLPAGADTVVGWFESVLTEMGDTQSLEQSLSSFGARLGGLKRALELGAPRVLVLLDEPTSGTDPEEGSALGRAVLEALAAQGASVAVTTHSEPLKELASVDPRFVNASFGLDPESRTPTFRLVRGAAGSSGAFALAARIGLPRAVLVRAEQLLPEHRLRREQLLRELEAERQALGRARQQLELELEAQAAARRHLEAEQSALLARHRDRLEQEARSLMVLVRQARADLEQAARCLREEKLDTQELREAERRISRAAAQVALGSPLVRALTPARPVPTPETFELSAGTAVYLPRLGAVGEVIEPPSHGRVKVRMGRVKVQVSTAEVEPPDGRSARARPSPARPRPDSAPRADRAARAAFRTQENTLDLRGERVEDALGRLDVFVDRMALQGHDCAFVLHGHGTGRLKASVREHLARSAGIERIAPADPEDGGDAFTVFWLKG